MMLNSLAVTSKQPKSLLNIGTGFLTGYTHTLNPYAGCSFGCSYCYVRQMPVALFRGAAWGTWVDIKEGAADVLRKDLRRAQAKGPVTIFMSSSTDPYQPMEYRARVTRSLLEAMADEQPEFLLVQTRSPLVRRDMDLLLRLGDKVRVSVTIETDLEPIRKAFTPYAPPIAARLQTLRLLREAGVPTQAAIAPVLPSSERFAASLREVVDRVVVDDYYMGDGSGGRRTQRLDVRAKYRELGLEQWYLPSAYLLVYEQLQRHFPDNQLFVSQTGFEP